MLRTGHTKTEGCFSSSRKELPGSVEITSTQPIITHVTTVVAGFMRYDGCIGKEHTDLPKEFREGNSGCVDLNFSSASVCGTRA